MSEVRITALLETDSPDKLRSVLNHHIDYLVDFDNNRDILTSARNVKSYCTDDRQDTAKLAMLADILGDILKDGMPSEKDLDNDWDIIEMYAAMESLKNAMADCGIYPEN